MAGKTVIKEKKAEIVKKYSRAPKDTGSPEVQVALLTGRINELNQHFNVNPKDFHSKRGLLKLVGQRRKMLKYLRVVDQKRYSQLIQALELRK
ncbi:MAG: 30S ribosomal protein S15 [Bdellovibrionales bacterium RIFOXYD1_FULL_53_11]|nr:MAG: 30S ribosomal protein S15 [Bdellovibrionales bacterium RIFOXYD1_FULL_53_11]